MGYTGHSRESEFPKQKYFTFNGPTCCSSQRLMLREVCEKCIPKTAPPFSNQLTRESRQSNMFMCSVHHALVLTPRNDGFLKQFVFFSQEQQCHYGTSKVIIIMVTKTLSWPRWQQSISYRNRLLSPTLILSSHLFQLTLDPAMKLDRWVKKLFHMRQKAINGEPLG